MKTKEIILKESPNTDEETLEHCLTAIQAMLDMDDFERAYDYLNGFVSEIIAQTREETIREEIAYWTDVFDNRPKDRDLESDNIAQNFARIEIERLENKLKK
jgi:hypothetical protein